MDRYIAMKNYLKALLMSSAANPDTSIDHGWAALPTEIQIQILEYIIPQHNHSDRAQHAKDVAVLKPLLQTSFAVAKLTMALYYHPTVWQIHPSRLPTRTMASYITHIELPAYLMWDDLQVSGLFFCAVDSTIEPDNYQSLTASLTKPQLPWLPKSKATSMYALALQSGGRHFTDYFPIVEKVHIQLEVDKLDEHKTCVTAGACCDKFKKLLRGLKPVFDLSKTSIKVELKSCHAPFYRGERCGCGDVIAKTYELALNGKLGDVVVKMMEQLTVENEDVEMT